MKYSILIIIYFLDPISGFRTGISVSCSNQCKCSEDVNSGLIDVICKEGELNDKGLREVLEELPLNTGVLSVISPEYKPSQFSLTQDLKHFKNLQELNLINAGIQSLGKRVFRDIKQLKKLNVAQNDIDYLTIDAFEGLNNLLHLDLSKNKLGKNLLPTGTFSQLKNLQYLSLAQNDISHFSGSLLSGLKNLKSLNLDNNRLDSGQLRALLSQLPNLRSLSISGCSFTFLETDSFKGMDYLEELNLSDNNLNSVPFNALKNLKVLRHLDLSDTNLTTIAPFSFKGLPTITSLNLARNDLGSCHSLEKTSPFHGLQPDSFEGVNLINLDLSYNNYKVFHSKYIGKAISTVRILHLSGNPLNTLNEDHVLNTKLTELHVSHINMQELPRKFPLDLALIRRLNISNNPIEDISYSTTRQLMLLQDLEELDISHCKLTSIASHVQSMIGRLETTYMHNNPFDCNCHILPIKDFLLLPRNRHRCNKLKIDQIVCASPHSTVGLPVVKVENPSNCAILFGASSGLTQQSEMGILVAIFCLLLLLVAVCLVIVFYTRTCRKKGSYRTREDSRRHLSGCSSEQDSIPNIDRPPLIAHDTLKERLF